MVHPKKHEKKNAMKQVSMKKWMKEGPSSVILSEPECKKTLDQNKFSEESPAATSLSPHKCTQNCSHVH